MCEPASLSGAVLQNPTLFLPRLSGTAVLAAQALTGSLPDQLQVNNTVGGGNKWDYRDLIGSTSGCH